VQVLGLIAEPHRIPFSAAAPDDSVVRTERVAGERRHDPTAVRVEFGSPRYDGPSLSEDRELGVVSLRRILSIIKERVDCLLASEIDNLHSLARMDKT
jgi:hypothetical protein